MLVANIALPAFFPHSFATLAGIFVIAAIEGLFLMRSLGKGFSTCYRASLSANLKSTFVGIPLAWLLWIAGLMPISWGLSILRLKTHPLMGVTAMHTACTGGLIPTEWTGVGSALAWNVLLIPFLFGSIWVERQTILRRFPDCDLRKITKAVIRGNITTYAIFFIIGVYGFIVALEDFPRQKVHFEEFRRRQEEYRRTRVRTYDTQNASGEQSGGGRR